LVFLLAFLTVIVGVFAVVSLRKDLAEQAEPQALASPQLMEAQMQGPSDGDIALPPAKPTPPTTNRFSELLTAAAQIVAIIAFYGVMGWGAYYLFWGPEFQPTP